MTEVLLFRHEKGPFFLARFLLPFKVPVSPGDGPAGANEEWVTRPMVQPASGFRVGRQRTIDERSPWVSDIPYRFFRSEIPSCIPVSRFPFLLVVPEPWKPFRRPWRVIGGSSL